MHNAFEHSVYVHHNNLSITNNVIRMDKDCLGGDIKTRGRGVSIVGNVIDGVNNGIFVGSHDERLGGNITVVGNAIRLRVLRGDSDKEWQGPNAGIQVVHNNKTLAMPNVTIQGNSVEWPNDVWLPTNMPAKFEKLRQEEHVGVHICAVPHPDNPIKYSNSTDQLCLGNVAINGNSFQNCSIGVLLKGDCYSNVQISGNVFMGKTCKTQDGKAFSDADPETYSSLFVLGICYSSEIKPTHNVVFSGNIARAFRAMVGHSLTAGSTAVTDADILFNDNRFWAIRRAYSGCNPPGRDAADFQFIMNSGGRIHDDSGYPLNRFWNDVPPPLPSLSVSGPDFIGPGTIAIDTDGQ